MKLSRLRMVMLASLTVLVGACVHQPRASEADAPSAKQSVGWPLLPNNEHLAAEFPHLAPTMGQESTHSTEIKEVLQEIDAENSRNNSVELKPSDIAIPKVNAADAEATSDSVTDTVSAYDTPLIFDIPVAYNSRVKYWIEFFQTGGRGWYQKWLERSSRYLPLLQKTLKKNGLPQDLAYIAMIESGFSSQASSTAKAVGPWQFIRETGKRYGLTVTWWLDERRDFQKSTDAAAKYLKRMYSMFHNWYLVAAGYNTGENRIKRAIVKNGTRNFWKIAQNKDLETETRDYVPKLIAALLIAKAPQMYGFKHVNYSQPLLFEHFRVPGGTRLDSLADAIGVTPKYMLELNPELVKGYVPNYVDGHMIRIPKGSSRLVGHFIRKNIISER